MNAKFVTQFLENAKDDQGRLYCAEQTTFIDIKMNQEEIKKSIQSFNDERPGSRKILVFAMSSMPKDIQLAKGDFCILLEPAYSVSLETQLFSYYHPHGNCIRLYVLYAENVEIEELMIRRKGLS